MTRSNAAIGIFDSGVGGLTVLRAVRELLPEESLCYLGDTARLPYGTKSQETVQRYAVRATAKLVRHDVKLLVVACNTASALALDEIRESFPGLPVVGVVEPGAQAACKASRSGRIGVLATESTTRHRAYETAISAIRADASVSSVACSLFVALAEEGWTSGEIAEGVARRYLEALPVESAQGVDCVVLGCTHFPPLKETIGEILGPDVTIVDSARTTAETVARELRERDLVCVPNEGAARHEFFATDAPDRFLRVAKRFLPDEFLPENVRLLDLT